MIGKVAVSTLNQLRKLLMETVKFKSGDKVTINIKLIGELVTDLKEVTIEDLESLVWKDTAYKLGIKGCIVGRVSKKTALDDIDTEFLIDDNSVQINKDSKDE
jgi:hypothetical protein